MVISSKLDNFLKLKGASYYVFKLHSCKGTVIKCCLSLVSISIFKYLMGKVMFT